MMDLLLHDVHQHVLNSDLCLGPAVRRQSVQVAWSEFREVGLALRLNLTHVFPHGVDVLEVPFVVVPFDLLNPKYRPRMCTIVKGQTCEMNLAGR